MYDTQILVMYIYSIIRVPLSCMSYVITHLTLFPVIFTIPQNTTFTKLYSQIIFDSFRNYLINILHYFYNVFQNTTFYKLSSQIIFYSFLNYSVNFSQYFSKHSTNYIQTSQFSKLFSQFFPQHSFLKIIPKHKDELLPTAIYLHNSLSNFSPHFLENLNSLSNLQKFTALRT